MFDASSGAAVVVAIDHGQHFGVLDGFEDPAATLESVLDGRPDGLIAGVPFLRRFDGLIPAEVTRIATVDVFQDSTLPGEDENAEIHRQVFSVEAADRAGADAIKAALVYGREEPAVLGRNLEFVGEIGEAARRIGLETVVEPTLWGERAEDEHDPRGLAHVNRIGFEMGADVLKSPYPGDPDAFEAIVDNAPVPVLIAGGPATESDRDALGMVREAMDAGASGVMIGRNIWQRDDTAAMVDAMGALVHEDASVGQALERL